MSRGADKPDYDAEELEGGRLVALQAELLADVDAESPPADLKARTMAAIAAEAEGVAAQSAPKRRGSAWPRVAWRPRPLLAGGLVAAAAVVAAVVLLPAGAPGAPTVGEASALSERPDTIEVVEVDPGNETFLDRDGSGVVFPNWAKAFGWRASGGRSDSLEGREATTTFYERVGDARSVAYTVVSGEPLELPAGSDQTLLKRGHELHSLELDGRTIVAFERLGHTVVLSGDASPEEMLRLAAWTGGGELPF